MNASQFSEQVQLIAFVLQKGENWNADVIEALEKTWGPIRHRGKLFAFDKTGYYEPEMGAGFRRPGRPEFRPRRGVVRKDNPCRDNRFGEGTQ